MPRIAVHSDSEESQKSKSKVAAEQNGSLAEEVDEDDASEYEIEQVLDARRGIFPDGRMGYLVKWKGYGPSENSWVDERDASNAKELVEKFWKKKDQAKNPRKSIDKKSPEKGRALLAGDESSDVSEVKPKKRGRKSGTLKLNSGDEMEVDQPEPQAKKARKSHVKKPRTETPEPDEQSTVGSMSRFMHMDTWEGLVASVDTVERAADGSLTVYFTLNSGESVMESSQVCNKRFPMALLKFYESNLKWRSVEELD